MAFKTAQHTFLIFGIKQAYACLFGGWLLTVILITAFWYPFHGLYRYDFLFIAAVGFQWWLLMMISFAPVSLVHKPKAKTAD